MSRSENCLPSLVNVSDSDSVSDFHLKIWCRNVFGSLEDHISQSALYFTVFKQWTSVKLLSSDLECRENLQNDIIRMLAQTLNAIINQKQVVLSTEWGQVKLAPDNVVIKTDNVCPCKHVCIDKLMTCYKMRVFYRSARLVLKAQILGKSSPGKFLHCPRCLSNMYFAFQMNTMNTAELSRPTLFNFTITLVILVFLQLQSLDCYVEDMNKSQPIKSFDHTKSIALQGILALPQALALAGAECYPDFLTLRFCGSWPIASKSSRFCLSDSALCTVWKCSPTSIWEGHRMHSFWLL